MAFSRYNGIVKRKRVFESLLLFYLVLGLFLQPASVQAARTVDVAAYDLIAAMNSLRVSSGLPALVEDPIIDAVAQSTAQIMADSQMSWHIGNVSGRLQSAGYGGGSKVWATENFAVGNQTSIDEIMVVWSDADHMLPAVIPAYCNVGAGTARAANGMTYYILQAAYTAGKSCGEYTSTGTSSTSGTTTIQSGGAASSGVSQLIMPVKIATPDAQGKVFHVVQAGQSFWAIAIAYKITIKDLKGWNNLSEDVNLKIGQKLFIPGSNTAGYVTPTQTGAIQVSTADADGRINHEVQSYQTLSTIAQAYGTTVEKILALNGLQADWPLRIGQKLLIHPGNVTPSATLQPVQMLTPASDGKYYHTVRSGETLSWIANRYAVTVNELMVWNGLSDASIIRTDQRLVLQVTPPATLTPTVVPVTVTVTLTPDMPTLTPEPASPTQPATQAAQSSSGLLGGAILLLGLGLGLAVFFYRRRDSS